MVSEGIDTFVASGTIFELVAGPGESEVEDFGEALSCLSDGVSIEAFSLECAHEGFSLFELTGFVIGDYAGGVLFRLLGECGNGERRRGEEENCGE